MRIGLWRSFGAIAVLFGFASGAMAKEKSWEVDIWDDEVAVTYVPDGRDDVHVYDHVNPWNDRSYIEVDRPRYRHRDRYEGHYGGGYGGGYGDRYDRYDRYDRHRGRHRHGWHQPRYRVEYHNRYRGW
jgi:hypothetical protein